MPIRPELRHLYRGPEYEARRARILERDGHRCKHCGVPNCKRNVQRWLHYWRLSRRDDWHGYVGKRLMPKRTFPPKVTTTAIRVVKRIVLTMAHLNHDPFDNDDANLAMLCQWCHLWHDREQHAQSAHNTRATRKDQARPLLAAVARTESAA
ncbi:MAG: hypothetical protein IT163_09760 [Bryobacterales bacterium]|nr:hypothetical protein [Bryobacterales bacterium]